MSAHGRFPPIAPQHSCTVERISAKAANGKNRPEADIPAISEKGVRLSRDQLLWLKFPGIWFNLNRAPVELVDGISFFVFPFCSPGRCAFASAKLVFGMRTT